MSRTNIHRPAWVMETDPRCRRWFTDQHDHSSGPCDLAEWLASGRGYGIRTRCRRLVNGAAPNLCGCNMCTGRIGQRLARRQERVAWRAHRRRLLTTVDRADVDVPPFRGKAW